MNRALRVAALAVTSMVLLAGCEFDGMSSLPVPFAAGTGSDAHRVTVEMADVANLVVNSEVKVDDLTVGTVTGVRFVDWHAELTVDLEESTSLPANAIARVGQKSLLGAQYLSLGAPDDGPPVGRLQPGDVVPLGRTQRYPTTEEFLGALSAVLSGGGLNQVQSINAELNRALGGHEQDVRSLVDRLGGFVGELNAQRDDIVALIDAMDRFGANLAAESEPLGRAIDDLGPGLAAIEEERPQFTAALAAVTRLSDTATRVVDANQEQLVANLRDLQPVLQGLADAGPDLPQALTIAVTFPFPVRTIPNFIRGDFANLWARLDVSLPTLDRLFLSGTPLQGVPSVLTQMLGGETGTAGPVPVPAPQLGLPGPTYDQQYDEGDRVPEKEFAAPPEPGVKGLVGRVVGANP